MAVDDSLTLKRTQLEGLGCLESQRLVAGAGEVVEVIACFDAGASL